MEKKEFDVMYKIEENHWWYASNRKMIFYFFGRYYQKNGKQIKILDAGCGTGYILKTLQGYGDAYGIEISDYALKLCKKRGFSSLKKASVQNIPFKANFFDAIGCFGVLYHKNVKDDEKAISELFRVCKNGGRAFITSPAHISLSFSSHDRGQHTRRRYTSKELAAKLKAAGFEIDKISYYNSLIFPAVYIKRWLEIKFGLKSRDAKKDNFIVNALLKSIMSFEIFLMRHIDFPFGVSIFCIAKKP